MRASSVTRRALATLGGLASVAALSLAPPANAGPPRVASDYYTASFNFPRYRYQPMLMNTLLQKMAQAGIRDVRAAFSWADMEPNPPSGTKHTYVFTQYDKWVTAAANKGIRLQPMFGYTPNWATDNTGRNCKKFGAHSPRPVAIDSWRLAVRAFAARYGKGGTFWSQHPGIPAKPMNLYEIWNEPNLNWYWCPAPQPGVYASIVHWAEREIRARDATARVITGGIPDTAGRPHGSADPPKEFLERMVNEAPSLLSRLSGIGVHPYAPGPTDRQLDVIANFRAAMRGAGIPDKMPMYATEIGWATDGANSISENERATRYYNAALNVPRTNCNVASLSAFTWISMEKDINNPFDWYGIARPKDGVPYLSGHVFGIAAQLMRGELNYPAPLAELQNCTGMPPLNRDGDAYPDHSDAFPIDPAQH